VWAAAALAVLIAIGFALSTSGVTEYEDGTPEATVQGYLNAVLDGDERAASTYLSAELLERCEDDSFIRFRDETSARIALTDTRVTGAAAVVEVRVSEGSYGLFDSSDYSHDEIYRLIQTEDGWLIDQLSWPWYGC